MNKKLLKVISFIICLVMISSFVLVACDEPDDGITITVTSDKTSLRRGESANITVALSVDRGYSLTVDKPDMARLNGTVLTVTGYITEETTITVTATLNSDKSVSGSTQITLLPPEQGELPQPTTTIRISSEVSVLADRGASAEFFVVASDGGAYTLSIDKPDLATLSKNATGGNEITYVGEITIDQYVTVTATLDSDPTIKGVKQFRLRAPVVDGQVGDLTSDMIKEIANENITVSGTLKDVYIDFNQAVNNSTTSYDITVKMDTDKWWGSWNASSNKNNVIVDSYEKGTTIVSDDYGNTGNALVRKYINKNNESADGYVTNYRSVPSVWEAQHLFNHLNALDISRFDHGDDLYDNIYEYLFSSSEADQYLKMYLAFSLTPLLDVQLDKFFVKIADGHITEIIAQTANSYLPAGVDSTEASAVEYTEVHLAISDIGTTTIPALQPYSAPEHAEVLQAAIDKLKTSDNYFMEIRDNLTSSPELDPGDYETQTTNASTSSSKVAMSGATPMASGVQNSQSAVGTEGWLVWVNSDAILIADTMKYSYSMDGRDYKTEYYGYKQTSDTQYDRFIFNTDATVRALNGVEKITGNVKDQLPKWDFSINLFELDDTETIDGKKYYTFALKDANISYDIGLEISMHDNAKNATSSVSRKMTITVSEDGYVVQTVFPYAFNGGDYTGYCQTKYTQYGSTTLPEGTFNDYVERVVITTWDQLPCKDYKIDPAEKETVAVNTDVALKQILGEAGMNAMFEPSLLLSVFGDKLSGPWYDYKLLSEEEGIKKYRYQLDINVTAGKCDQNGVLQNFDEVIAELSQQLATEGFSYSAQNSTTSNPFYRFVTYVKGDVTFVVENIGYKTFYLHIYKTGTWTLN